MIEILYIFSIYCVIGVIYSVIKIFSIMYASATLHGGGGGGSGQEEIYLMIGWIFWPFLLYDDLFGND